MPLISDLQVRATLDHTSALDLSTVSAPLDYLARIRLSSGTGASAADMAWHDTRTITASGTDSLDLAGTLVGPFGATLTFARIKGIVVAAAAGNTNDVQVTRPASSGEVLFLAAGDGIPVPPGGVFAWFCPTATGIVTTAGTGDLLAIVNGGAGTSVTYDVIVIGASA